LRARTNYDDDDDVVQYMDKDVELEYCFGWLADELKQNREKTERTLTYCQTIRQRGILCATIKALLGKHMFVGDDPRNVFIEMMKSCTPAANKENILESFQSDNGTIRLLIATIVFRISLRSLSVGFGSK